MRLTPSDSAIRPLSRVARSERPVSPRRSRWAIHTQIATPTRHTAYRKVSWLPGNHDGAAGFGMLIPVAPFVIGSSFNASGGTSTASPSVMKASGRPCQRSAGTPTTSPSSEDVATAIGKVTKQSTP